MYYGEINGVAEPKKLVLNTQGNRERI